ncbi:ATP-dependent zinc protease family protein [Novipirellula galeiformis]|uniref:ATP-dependent zinc protease family protein n=1 Tax=Novipirellula galeiformis TaxID=2528004 RepID=UPI001E4ED033|nr:RimK/LysX family protein [Novipirellula galeiformis]
MTFPTDSDGASARRSNVPAPVTVGDQWIIGWREWVSLPSLGIRHIKAKIDTGARSSSLHAFNIETFETNGVEMVRFDVHPHQRSDAKTIVCEAPIHDIRSVRSSSGEASKRIFILTEVHWLETTWQVELTLANRYKMGFRMLLGREAVRGRMLVEPGQSYFGGRPPKKKKKH